MAIIEVEFDNTLQQSEILIPLASSSKPEAGENYYNDQTDKAQTAVFGIKVPIIMINSTVIDFDAVHYFSLKSEGTVPELTVTVEDKYELINNIDKPGIDNEVRVQILPQFDDTYKKINLTFYISSIQVNGSIIRLTCAYKLPKLTSSKFESYGNIDTYNLLKTIATDTKLGFASNIKASHDSRYIYCNNKSLLDLMNDEIQYSKLEEGVLDYWIDFWNNINIADIKERYEAVDPEEKLKIWVAGQINDATAGVEYSPLQIPALIDNFPGHNMSELFVKNYMIYNNPGINFISGSDRVYSIYEENNDEYLDFLVQDGDVKKDVFTKYEYLGEAYGDYNYLLSKCLRNTFLQKMKTDQVKVTLQAPQLGLMRGHKVNFIRYTNDSKLEGKMKALEDNGAVDRNIDSNIPLDQFEMEDNGYDGKFIVDRTASGQYLISAVNYIYTNKNWEFVLTLVRPKTDVPKILKES